MSERTPRENCDASQFEIKGAILKRARGGGGKERQLIFRMHSAYSDGATWFTRSVSQSVKSRLKAEGGRKQLPAWQNRTHKLRRWEHVVLDRSQLASPNSNAIYCWSGLFRQPLPSERARRFCETPWGWNEGWRRTLDSKEMARKAKHWAVGEQEDLQHWLRTRNFSG